MSQRYEVFNFDAVNGGKSFIVSVNDEGEITSFEENDDSLDVSTPWDICESEFPIGSNFNVCVEQAKRRMIEWEDEYRRPSFIMKKII
jgi:hypothetical protein